MCVIRLPRSQLKLDGLRDRWYVLGMHRARLSIPVGRFPFPVRPAGGRLATTVGCCLALMASALGARLEVQRLRCEYRANPTGMDVLQPRFSWEVLGAERGARQTAYELLVASSESQLAANQGDLWASGRIESDETAHIVYAGRPLQSRDRCWWKVRVWDGQKSVSKWSPPASWTMGLLETNDWRASWIADARQAATVVGPSARNGFHSTVVADPNTVQSLTIDLGRTQAVDAVKLFPARPFDFQPDTPGFLFPLRFKVETATQPDFTGAALVVDHTQADEPNPGTNAAVCRFTAQPTRWLRLTVTRLRERDPGNCAFALAELQALQGDQVVSQGAQVGSEQAIDGGAWAKAHLTDGVLRTVPPGGEPGTLPATMARRSFQIGKPVRRATVYSTALGVYELRLNGQRITDLLAPEWTSYRNRVQYQTRDVTRLLRRGQNVVAAMMGEGWYAGRLMLVGRFAYGTHPRLLAQLEVEYEDGSRETVVADASWRTATDGPITAAGIYDGETWDDRKAQPGWDLPGFDDHQWPEAAAFPLDGRKLVWQRNEPIGVTSEIEPGKLAEPKHGAYVFDLGQNLVGWCRLRAKGRAGQPVVLRHAEMLNEDGTPYTANLRGAPQVDRFIPSGDGAFVFEPRFTYHGFRYVEVSGLAEPPGKGALRAFVIHSRSPEAGHFECSDASVNQLMRNILWTQRANLMSSPNDCPQRDERFGWMGDIQSFGQTAMFNLDMAAFGSKWVQDIRDDQAADGRFPDFAPHPGDPNRSFSGAPAWADAGVIYPWRHYQNYADLRLLAEHFDAAQRWVDCIHKLNPDLIWRQGRQNDYNDWLNGDWIKQQGWPAKGASVPNELLATAFFAHSTELTARMANMLGRQADAARLAELAARIKAAFRKEFLESDGRLKGDTQGGYALALNFDLLPADHRARATGLLVEGVRRYQNHLSTGIQTTHRAMLELSRNGVNDVAWQMLTNRTFPSWFYMIDNGATTIWERWDGYVKGRGFQDAGMNSFNHWALGSVGEWVWRNVAGLNPDDAQPGWKHFMVAPRPGGGVTWARASYLSLRGEIRTEWKLEQGRFALQLVIPANTTATVRIPTRQAELVTEGKRPAAQANGVRFVGGSVGAATFEVSSGRYEFAAPW